MADTYIDYAECGEYAEHLCETGKGLAGASPHVNLPAIFADVLGDANAVDAELEKQKVKIAAITGTRKTVTAAMADAKIEIVRFFNYLGSLKKDVSFEINAFFPGGILGNLSRMKPADVQKKLRDIQKGFSAKENKDLPEAAEWKKTIDDAEATLTSAIEAKTGSVGQKLIHTPELVQAKLTFLKSYQSAKRIVQGVLIKLGREKELRVYFKDLTVTDTKPKKNGPGGKGPAKA